MIMKKSGGFTLIEVLISVVILAMGLLGLAALQATALRNTQSAYYRSLASQLAYDMADRLRANVVGAAAKNYDKATAASTPTCSTSPCTADQMAAYDVYQWNTALSVLPSGVGLVCLDSSPNDGATYDSPACDGVGTVYAIKIWWDDDRQGAASQRFNTAFQS